ncbi:hypothetical protein Tco_0788272 [Tanacetum coccineum]
MVIDSPYYSVYEELASPEQTATDRNLLIQVVAVSLDSAVHRVHAVSFDAAVASAVSAVCMVAAGYIVSADFMMLLFTFCSFLLAVQDVPADYVSADHVLNSADRYRIC